MRSVTLLALIISCLRVDAAPLTLIEKNKKAAAGADNGGPSPGKTNRVVGGKKVTSATKYKWFVEWADASCGGSLIHDDIVLSAAHCESKTSPFNMRVYVNGLTSRGGLFRTIQQQVSHPLYKVESNNDYDIMLLKLHDSAKYDEHGKDTGVDFVHLNTDRNTPQPDDPLLAVGFGFTAEGAGQTSAVMNDVEVKYVSDEECLSQYGKEIYVADLMFCAGVEGGGKDTCQGDSGGPILDMKTMNQVGVVSFGSGCARATHNGVYARVSAVTDWLKSSICALSDYPPADCPYREPFNGIGEGLGSMSVTVTYDGYARETAFMLVNDEHNFQVYFQPYDAKNAINGKTETHDFEKLPAGKYTLMLGDDARDGFCCGYGRGQMTVKDKTSGKVLWTVTDNWASEYIAGKFSISESGVIDYNGNTTEYDNSWELSPVPPNIPEENDQQWPGPIPNSPKKLNINIRFDRFPKETTWTLAKHNDQKDGWHMVETFDGEGEAVHNDLVSTDFSSVCEGWYRFSIKDRKNDGICCENRRGWVTITGFLEESKQPGVVWSDDGEFGSGTEVYFEILKNGMVGRIVDDESDMER